MPRLRNKQTGSVVSCSDATAARLGAEWQPAEAPKTAEKKSAAKKSSK